MFPSVHVELRVLVKALLTLEWLPHSVNNENPCGIEAGLCFGSCQANASPRVVDSRMRLCSNGGSWSSSTLASLPKRTLQRVPKWRPPKFATPIQQPSFQLWPLQMGIPHRISFCDSAKISGVNIFAASTAALWRSLKSTVALAD